MVSCMHYASKAEHKREMNIDFSEDTVLVSFIVQILIKQYTIIVNNYHMK